MVKYKSLINLGWKEYNKLRGERKYQKAANEAGKTLMLALKFMLNAPSELNEMKIILEAAMVREMLDVRDPVDKFIFEFPYASIIAMPDEMCNMLVDCVNQFLSKL